MKDEIFKKPIEKQFEFDNSVASVFDDMINRSVPYYDTAQNLIADITDKFLKKSAKVVDLGCSTASTLLKISHIRGDLDLTGVDNAPAMIENARAKIAAFGANIKLINADILEFNFNADAVLLNYTLQFIRPPKRRDFVDKIYSSVNEGGLFIFSEKLVFENKILTKNMIEIYEKYKLEQGYSRYEIAQKREALENVLIPYTEQENIALAEQAGFKDVQCVFKWGNFATFVAFK
jgi:hypothetical protein